MNKLLLVLAMLLIAVPAFADHYMVQESGDTTYIDDTTTGARTTVEYHDNGPDIVSGACTGMIQSTGGQTYMDLSGDSGMKQAVAEEESEN